MKSIELVKNNYSVEERIKRFKHCYKYIDDPKDIQAFVDVIYDIIDECDYISFKRDSEYTEKFYKNLKYIEYDHVYVNTHDTDAFGKKILDITAKEAKQYLKDNIRFCLCPPWGEREPIKVDIIHKNIENYDLNSLYYHFIYFIKDNRIQYSFSLFDGWLLDYK